MNTKNNRRAQETRERLKLALLEMLARDDILDVTVSALCDEAQVNRSTFYSHYDSVAELMDEIEQETGKDIFEKVAEVYDDEKSMFSTEYLLAILGHLKENRSFYRAYLRQSVGRRNIDWGFGQLLEQFVKPMMKRLGVDDIETAYYFEFFKEGFIAVISLWLDGGCRDEPETIAHCITSMLNHPEFEIK